MNTPDSGTVVTEAQVIERLTEQLANAEIFAGIRKGKDRDDWLDDARHYKAAIELCKRALEPAGGIGEELLDGLTREEIIRIRNTCCGNEWPKVWSKQLMILCDCALSTIGGKGGKRLPQYVIEEFADGDKICEALGLERTEGGRLPMYKILASLRSKE